MRNLSLMRFYKSGRKPLVALMPGGTSGGDARLRLKPRSMLQTTIAVGALDTTCPVLPRKLDKDTDVQRLSRTSGRDAPTAGTIFILHTILKIYFYISKSGGKQWLLSVILSLGACQLVFFGCESWAPDEFDSPPPTPPVSSIYLNCSGRAACFSLPVELGLRLLFMGFMQFVSWALSFYMRTLLGGTSAFFCSIQPYGKITVGAEDVARPVAGIRGILFCTTSARAVLTAGLVEKKREFRYNKQETKPP